MRPRVMLALAIPVLAACARRSPQHTTADSAGGMPGMPGMEGMAEMPGMAGGDSGMPVDWGAARRLGITFARAVPASIARSVRLAGTLTYPEPRRVYVNARVSGWVERLFADYVGKPVREGEPLLALYSPELVSAQEEYLTARRLRDSALVAAARRRLELWNISEAEIASLDQRGTAERTLVIRAPRSGEVAEKMVTEGQAVRAGENLFLIADRSVLWVEVAVFEMDAPAVRIGTAVTVTVPTQPGRRYRGRVSFIRPEVEEKTRTLTARVEVSNRDGTLRPGMYVTAEIAPRARQVLAVPREAVLPTGERNLVFVNRGDGRFLPREVVVGVRSDSLIEIVRGLKVGDEVIASATYLLDSESNLAAAMQGLMLRMGMGLDMGGMRMPAETSRRERRP
ncbi:MAG: efflux RND transporter periplasmic adaptor subunit [Gemmatimonadales bacterium]